jgi:hypothetical protein
MYNVTLSGFLHYVGYVFSIIMTSLRDFLSTDYTDFSIKIRGQKIKRDTKAENPEGMILL